VFGSGRDYSRRRELTDRTDERTTANEPASGDRTMRERMPELGRASCAARRRRAQPQSFRQGLRAWLAGEPVTNPAAAQLVSTGAGAVKAVTILQTQLGARGGLDEDSPYRPREPRPERAGGSSVVDVLRVLWESNPELLERWLVEAGVLEPEPDEEGS
jgi:hypothetical protein